MTSMALKNHTALHYCTTWEGGGGGGGGTEILGGVTESLGVSDWGVLGTGGHQHRFS